MSNRPNDGRRSSRCWASNCFADLFNGHIQTARQIAHKNGHKLIELDIYDPHVDSTLHENFQTPMSSFVADIPCNDIMDMHDFPLHILLRLTELSIPSYHWDCV